jgi:hypothetical protein
MSGALNSVFGSVGGAIANAALNVASVAFPPLAVATTLGNLVTQGIGQAVCQAANTLTQVAGMPKFIAQEVAGLVGNALSQLLKPSDPGCDQHIGDTCRNPLQDFIKGFADGIVKDACKEMEGKGKGGSWFEALAKALGKALDAQAAEVQKLSEAVQGQNASDNPSGFTDLQAASQRMSFMMSAADQVIKTIGEGLGALARK